MVFFNTLIKSSVQHCVIIVYLYFSVTDEDTVKRYYAKFEEKFFQTCEKELAKINTFYSGNDCNEGLFTRERFHVKTVTFCHVSAAQLNRKGVFSPWKWHFLKTGSRVERFLHLPQPLFPCKWGKEWVF